MYLRYSRNSIYRYFWFGYIIKNFLYRYLYYIFINIGRISIWPELTNLRPKKFFIIKNFIDNCMAGRNRDIKQLFYGVTVDFHSCAMKSLISIVPREITISIC